MFEVKEIAVKRIKQVKKSLFLPISFLAVSFLMLILWLFFIRNIFAETQKDILRKEINDEKIWEEIKHLSFPEDNFNKMLAEIRGVKAKYRKGNPYEQYVLKVRLEGTFLCYNCENQTIF